jgi:hypothetical protein
LPSVGDVRFRVRWLSMNKSAAIGIRNEALKAIEALSSVLDQAQSSDDEAGRGRLHKQIGQIQMGILEPIVAEYPDLDDLR